MFLGPFSFGYVVEQKSTDDQRGQAHHDMLQYGGIIMKRVYTVGMVVLPKTEEKYRQCKQNYGETDMQKQRIESMFF